MNAPKKILVVDDERIIADILTRRFNRIGFDVYTANNGNQAMNLLRKKAIDLIICDIKMPGSKSAKDVLRYSLNSNPKTKFIAMSGTIKSDKSVQEIMQEGANLFIKKPFSSLNTLTSEILKVLN